jgi:N-acetyl-1-D-myo-inositol-2-amino-2-deoxy-alpha-D-glucopyranoside deacetylase
MSDAPDRRVLFVHAHPDDESINNGATMARYAAEGALVTLVTCTLGEEGEVIPPELGYLAADREGTLGAHRVGELATAMQRLGVRDHRFLGGPGRYRDSGMMGLEQNARPGCFWQAPLDEAAASLVAVLREVRPQVVVTYDPHGGYGHPDHIQAHRVAMRAVELAADGSWRRDLGDGHTVDRVYWNCIARSAAEDGFARLAAMGERQPFPGVGRLADLPGVVEDAEVAVRIDGGARYGEAKRAAMRAHRTQITVEGDFFALSNDLGQPLLTTEDYRLADGRTGGARAGSGEPADDLFAGVAS